MAGKNDALLAATVGVTGFALVRALIDHLQDSGALSDRQVLGIIEAAHRKVDILQRTNPHPSFATAALSLASEADTARKKLRPTH